MKRKKIAMVLVTDPCVGGGHQYALLIAECLKELPRSKYELIAICSNPFWIRWCRKNHIKKFSINWHNQEIKEIMREIKFPVLSGIYNAYMTELGKLVRKEKIDVLFVTAQLCNIPNIQAKIITPVHDLMHRYEASFPEVKDEYEWREAVFKWQARFADYILTDSKLGKRQFIESYLKKNERRPHITVLPFVVPNYISEIEEEYIEVPDRYIFYPAQFWKHKNHVNLVKAIQILKEDLEDIQLVLVGSEKNSYKEIAKYIADNELQSNILIKGFVSNENITYLYRHAVGMVMPSYFGPTNIPPLEAMALGCPVAVSNKYAMPEQVGDAGLFFDPDSPEEIAECIRKMWTDEKLRKEMIEKGYRKINAWTGNDFKDKIIKMLEKCCKEF